MLVDSREPALSATRPFIPALFPNVDRSGMTEGSVSMVGSGRESMAVSLDQARLGRALVELGLQLVVELADTALLYTKLGASLFPAVVDRACFEDENRENAGLENRLRMAFEAEPLEDGIDHPAERNYRRCVAVGTWTACFGLVQGIVRGRRAPGLGSVGSTLPGPPAAGDIRVARRDSAIRACCGRRGDERCCGAGSGVVG